MNYSGCLTLLATPGLRPVCTGGKCGLCPLRHGHDPRPPPGSDQSLQWEAPCRQHPHHWRPRSWGYFRWNPVSIPLGIHLKENISWVYITEAGFWLDWAWAWAGWLISLNRYNKYSVSVPDLINFIPDPVLVPLKRLTRLAVDGVKPWLTKMINSSSSNTMIRIGNLDLGHLIDTLNYLATPTPKSSRFLITFSWIM